MHASIYFWIGLTIVLKTSRILKMLYSLPRTNLDHKFWEQFWFTIEKKLVQSLRILHFYFLLSALVHPSSSLDASNRVHERKANKMVTHANKMVTGMRQVPKSNFFRSHAGALCWFFQSWATEWHITVSSLLVGVRPGAMTCVFFARSIPFFERLRTSSLVEGDHKNELPSRRCCYV